MAEFKEVMKHKQRIHEHFSKYGCDKCPISRYNNGRHIGCGSFIVNYPQEAEEIIMKWAEEHPIKTNEDKFKEVFGFLPKRCPHDCKNNVCSTCEHNNFWTEVYKEPDKE